MHNFVEEISSDNFDLLDILADIRVTNVTEIKVIQEIVNYLDTQYQEHKTLVNLATIAALILNRPDIPNLYATSSKGYNNQMLTFQNQFGIYGVKVREELIPWAIEDILRKRVPHNLDQGFATPSAIANAPSHQILLQNENMLEILANLNLINVTEFQVVKATVNYIHLNYPQAIGRINLSDIFALILNHETVSSLYATSPEEYNLLTQTYLSQHQSEVNQIVEQMVAKVYAEGLEQPLNLNSLITANHQRRKKLTKSWQI